MSNEPATPWEALRAGFRRACVRRLVRDEEGAVEVLKDEIPGLVVGWAKTVDLEPAEKKAKLKELFDDESARAEELAVAFDLFAARFELNVADRVSREVKKVSNGVEKLAAKYEETFSALVARFEEGLAGLKALTEKPLNHIPAQVETAPSEPAEASVPAPPPNEERTPELKPEQADPEPEQTPPAEEPNEQVPAPKEEELEQEEEASEFPDPPEEAPLATPKGIAFDDIEGMIDELLAREDD